MEALMLEPAVRTDPGRVRSHNEDAVFASPRLAAVADGVGGAAAGEVASHTVINALAHLDKCWLDGRLEDALTAAVASGNETIAFIVSCRPRTLGMGTTLTAVALDDDGAYVVANIGDSRTYLLRDGALSQLTRDDSFVQLMIDRGTLTAAEALAHPQRSLVLRALDGDPSRTATVSRVTARLGDRLLLCSDGLSDLVADEAIADALRAGDRAACADRLIDLSLAAGGRDNISVVVADVTPRVDPAGPGRLSAPSGRRAR